ncbi:hypothetical protein DFR50_14034 [Roseiarcus fermentans]|uniref:Uncharacterized protein n=1 Tax=Roseiarcus fermentans TaxID=1473586 RepID=A0A366EP43_9HYPH|nr:hypothetical protein DFR50_14034 [Roseiarcus fermentans]
MKQGLILGIALAAAISLPVLAAPSGSETPPVHPHRHLHHHIHGTVVGGAIAPNATAQVAPPAPAWGFPHIAPFPDGQGDVDGLSRHKSDCNEGCIDGPS